MKIKAYMLLFYLENALTTRALIICTGYIFHPNISNALINLMQNVFIK